MANIPFKDFIATGFDGISKMLRTKSEISNTKDNPANVQVTGSNLEYYGATESERPLTSDVPVGSTYMAVQTQQIWQSDGTDWVVM